MSMSSDFSSHEKNRHPEASSSLNPNYPAPEHMLLPPKSSSVKLMANGEPNVNPSVPQNHIRNPFPLKDPRDIFKNRLRTMETRSSGLNNHQFDRKSPIKPILERIKKISDTTNIELAVEDMEPPNYTRDTAVERAFLLLSKEGEKNAKTKSPFAEFIEGRKGNYGNYNGAHSTDQPLESNDLQQNELIPIQLRTYQKNFKKQLLPQKKSNSQMRIILPEAENHKPESNNVQKEVTEEAADSEIKKKQKVTSKDEKSSKKTKKGISKLGFKHSISPKKNLHKKKAVPNDIDVIQTDKILLTQEKIKTTAKNATNIKELFPEQFFKPDTNFVNANPFIDISNLASRKNTNELFQHLLNSKMETDPTTFEKIPNNFNSPFDYLTVFKPLFLNEVTARIGNLLKDLQRPKGQNYSLVPFRIRMLPDQGISDFTYFEITEIKYDSKKFQTKPESEPNVPNTNTNPSISNPANQIRVNSSNDPTSQNNSTIPQNKNLNSNETPVGKKIDLLDTCFDIKYSKNYLVLLTNFSEVKIELLRDDEFNNKNFFLILGIVMSEKGEQNSELAKVVTNIKRENFTKYLRNLKSEWMEVNLMPLEKITTFLREYFAIQNLQYEEISKRIYKPRMSLVNNNMDNLSIMSKFFESVQKQYNDSQFQAIKEICSVKEGISLLQGPPGTGKTFTLIGIASGLYHYIKHSGSTYKRYIMICAPSNAAIDEIIIRIKKKGLIDENGNSVKPQLIRIGVLDNNPSEIVKGVSLEHLAQEILFNQEKISMKKEQSTAVEIRQMLEKVNAKIQKIKKECGDDVVNNKGARKFLDALFDKRRRLNFDYHNLKQNKVNYKEKYKQIVDNLLIQAEIICCTLSSAGSDKMEFFKNKIEALIVDEASQCTEPTNIIPFQLSINKVILIGDPKQLPATTFSSDSNKTLYNRSLFERFIDNGILPFFLDEQYRMHENIREFPSLTFYSNRLKDGDNIKTRKFPKYLVNFELFNLFFIDLVFSKERVVDYSYSNEDEAQMALKICKFLIRKNQNLGDQTFFSRIGLITPYKRQVNFFRDIYKKEVSNKYHQIQINTVDSFQGQEKDIIIFSTVRSSHDSRDRDNLIGFLDDTRRMNVALTRSKYVLIIIGNGDTLSSNEVWSKLLNHMIMKGCYYKLSKPDDMDTFSEIMFRNPREIPVSFKKTTIIFPFRTLKKHKTSENSYKATLFEQNFAKNSFKHNRPRPQESGRTDLRTLLENDNLQEQRDEEKSEEGKGEVVEDILTVEDHSYLFKNNEQKSNLMCLISKKSEINEERLEPSTFNIFQIANNIKY